MTGTLHKVSLRLLHLRIAQLPALTIHGRELLVIFYETSLPVAVQVQQHIFSSRNHLYGSGQNAHQVFQVLEVELVMVEVSGAVLLPIRLRILYRLVLLLS